MQSKHKVLNEYISFWKFELLVSFKQNNILINEKFSTLARNLYIYTYQLKLGVLLPKLLNDKLHVSYIRFIDMNRHK